MGVLGWAAFGLGVRMWQLGIEMRPLFSRKTALTYPLYASVTGALGYYLEGVDVRQKQILAERRATLLAKRARQAERDAVAGSTDAGPLLVIA